MLLVCLFGMLRNFVLVDWLLLLLLFAHVTSDLNRLRDSSTMLINFSFSSFRTHTLYARDLLLFRRFCFSFFFHFFTARAHKYLYFYIFFVSLKYFLSVSWILRAINSTLNAVIHGRTVAINGSIDVCIKWAIIR